MRFLQFLVLLLTVVLTAAFPTSSEYQIIRTKRQWGGGWGGHGHYHPPGGWGGGYRPGGWGYGHGPWGSGGWGHGHGHYHGGFHGK